MLTEREIVQELTKRTRTLGLRVDCLSSGSPLSEIVIIGESPGERDTIMKMPMVGGAGQKLWSQLAKVGVNRSQCYITNVSKRMMAFSTKTETREPMNKLEQSHWEGVLEWELKQLPNVKYVLVLGNMAMHALFQRNGIMDWRGSVLQYTQFNGSIVPTVLTYNPAMLLREPKLDIIFAFDINKLGMVMKGNYHEHVVQANINPSFKEAYQWIDKMHDDRLPIALDIETMANETACIGLANDTHTGMCINFRDHNTNRYTVRDERIIRKRIARLCNDENTKLVAQNGGFDSYWLWYKDRIRLRRIWFDTLLAHHTLYPRLPHNLGFITSQYTTHPYYKDEGTNWREGGNINELWSYNVKDCCITLAAQQKMIQELEQQKLSKFFFEHVMMLQPELVGMTVGGVLADTSLKHKIRDEVAKDVDSKLEEFYSAVAAATGEEDYQPNPKSPKQVANLLFNKLHLVGRGTSTNEENRNRMRTHPKTSPEAKRVIECLNDYSTENKFLTTYAEMKIDGDRRIRCEYKQYGTVSAPGRLSSTKVMWGTGMNLQNQPQRAYPMFIADPAYEFSYFDLSQAEARVVAYAWKVRGLIANFVRAGTEKGFDVHRGNAARIFKCDYDDIPSFDRYDLGKTTDDPKLDGAITKRFLGKRCVHGLNYRMMASRLADTCGIPLWQADEAYQSYHAAFPEIQEAWRQIIREVKETKMIFNCFGRRLLYLEELTEEALESVVAFVPQSTIGDKVSSVIYQCHNDPDWPRLRNGNLAARISLNIHDALIALNRPVDGACVRAIMKKYAEAPIPIRGEMVVIPADFKVSKPDEHGVHRWSTLSKVA